MTDFTGEEMMAIILRSLNANAARMRKKYKLKRERPAAQATGARKPRGGTPATPEMALDRSGE